MSREPGKPELGLRAVRKYACEEHSVEVIEIPICGQQRESGDMGGSGNPDIVLAHADSLPAARGIYDGVSLRHIRRFDGKAGEVAEEEKQLRSRSSPQPNW